MPPSTPQQSPFSSADIGALAHLYRGELYRSTVWRTRLDSTTNWAVATTGIALTVTFEIADEGAVAGHRSPIRTTHNANCSYNGINSVLRCAARG